MVLIGWSHLETHDESSLNNCGQSCPASITTPFIVDDGTSTSWELTGIPKAKSTGRLASFTIKHRCSLGLRLSLTLGQGGRVLAWRPSAPELVSSRPLAPLGIGAPLGLLGEVTSVLQLLFPDPWVQSFDQAFLRTEVSLLRGPLTCRLGCHVIRPNGIVVCCSPTEVVLPGAFQGLSKMVIMCLFRKPGGEVGTRSPRRLEGIRLTCKW